MGRLHNRRRVLNLAEAASDAKVMASVSRVLSRSPYSIADVQPLANGGQGVLYRVAPEDRDPVVLKIPSYGTCPETEHWILEHTLRKEIGILQRYPCDSIPLLLHYHEDDAWMFREYVDGSTLDARLATDTLTVADRVSLCRGVIEMARPLFAAFHESTNECLVLRDFKPVNIVVEADFSRMKLVDVGSARPEVAMLSRSPRPHRLGSGKWLYWAPEQLLGRSEDLDRRADYFSLAATAYTILTSTAPYSNSNPDPLSALETYNHEYLRVCEGLRVIDEHMGVLPDYCDF